VAASTPRRRSRRSLAHSIARSAGRTGVCWHNAAAESFWATLKVEFYDRFLWPTRAVAKLAVGDWIERVYNRRRHSPLGMISPVEFENRLTQTAQAASPCVHSTGSSPVVFAVGRRGVEVGSMRVKPFS
jgi:putative transposase